MAETIKTVWAWAVSIFAGAWGVASDTRLLTALAVFVAIATIFERVASALKSRAQHQLAMVQIDQLKGS